MKRDGIGKFLAEIFVWWHGQTWGTRLALRFRFDYVGEDELGNRYWQERAGPRRWVTYNGPAEASKIPPGWHAWMHNRSALPPTEQSYTPHSWQRAHLPNLTGTAAAYRPEGSLLKSGERPRVTGDYDAWSPQ
jgi:NADH:ubiquinone oxidoreductase subunit